MPDSADPEARADRLHRRVGELARDRPIPVAELDALDAELDGILDAIDTLRVGLPELGASGAP